ncbi:MAG: hypothetical protein COW63_17110 [Bacteroidetes bacterium CG18_big_fil_WC_8_21_14_2_50_41_14]|nr:MAG: hypothetical protein COW63_17110 [Bacteroidetes bacterium CG18_big_fil_WC_8_21_14_2_50_41_14]PJB55215.1 MAG: hypothetical protein CO098_17460 [Bacteroidetes bacterium CG_4_9_14_3_um_filter_41_19]
MNKMMVLLSVFNLLMLGIFAQTSNRFAVKSGHIEYKLTGNITGIKSVWFNDYGYNSYEETRVKRVTIMLGVKSESTEHKLVIITGTEVYHIDLLDKTGTKMKNEFSDLSQQLISQMTEDERKQMGKELLNSMGGNLVGTEKILGKTCDIVEVLGTKSWIYEGVTLKSEGKVMGIEANEIAVKFEENIHIPTSKFEVPKGIVIEDLTQITHDLMVGTYDENGDYIENEQKYGNDEEMDVAEVSYLFEDFKKVVLDFNPAGYTRGMILNQEGQHFALYMKGMNQMVTVIATSMENVDSQESEFSGFEEFTHHGRTMRYGLLEEDGTTSNALLIKYNNHDMYIILMALPANDKNTLLNWADGLDF